MPRLKPVDNASATSDAKELFDTIRATYGSTPDIVRAMANSPALLKGYVELSNALADTDKPAERANSDCHGRTERLPGYCLSAHTAGGRAAGLNTEELARSRSGDSADPRIAAALAFARAVNTNRGGVDGQRSRSPTRGHDDGDIAAIVGHVALNALTN